MGVERQHAVVYGYIVDVTKEASDSAAATANGKSTDPYLSYPEEDADPGEFVTLTPNYGRCDELVAGVLSFITDSTRWEGPQELPLQRLEQPDPATLEAIDETIEELAVQPRHPDPAFITLTHKW